MNAEQKLNRYKRIAIAAIGLTAIAGIILFCFCATPDNKYFISSPLAVIARVIIILGLVAAASSFIILKGAGNVDFSRCARPKYLYCISCIAAAYVFVTTGKQLVASQFEIVWLIIAIATAFSLIYFTSGYVETNKTLTLISGYFHIVFCIAVIAKLYFDQEVELNAPVKLYIQFTAALSMLSTLNSLRALIDKCSIRLYAGIKTALLSLSALSSIASLYAAITSRHNYSSDYWVFSAYFFACAILEAVEYFSIQAVADVESKAPIKITDEAESNDSSLKQNNA